MATVHPGHPLTYTPLLADLTAEESLELSSLLVEEVYPAGVVIFEENSVGDAFYIVKSGRVEISKHIGGYENTTIVLGEVTDFFGEMALLEHMPRSATARTLEPTCTLRLGQKDFDSLLVRSPRVYCRLTRALSSRLRDVHETLIKCLQAKNDELRRAYDDLKEAQSRLIAREKLATLGMAAARIIHDIRNPMTGIMAYAELIRLRPAESGKYADVIVREADRLTDMLQELMDFAQGKDPELWLAPHDLSEFVDRSVSLMQAILAPRPIRLETDLRYRGLARFDVQRMGRVLHNLLLNAVEASPPEGAAVRIQVDAEDRTLVFRIVDSGPGIPAEVAEHLFEPFVTHGKPRGIGLGLAICRSIVEAHGGTIAIDHLPDVGTTVVVRLPDCVSASSE